MEYRLSFHMFHLHYFNYLIRQNNHDVTFSTDLKKIKDKQIIRLPLMAHLSEQPDFMPFAIPDDIADRLKRVHMNPAVWWIGQFVDYLIRPNKDLKLYLRREQGNLVFGRPIVGWVSVLI